MNASDEPTTAPVTPEPKPGRFSIAIQADASSAGALLVLQQRAIDEALFLSQQNQARALRYPTDEVPAWSHQIKGTTPHGTFSVTFADGGFSL